MRLCVGDGHAGLFLAAEGVERAVELLQQASGFGVAGDGFLGVLKASDRRVGGHKLAQLLGFGQDLLRIDWHLAPS